MCAAAWRRRTMEEHLTMSRKERTRMGVMEQVKAQQITLVAACDVLGWAIGRSSVFGVDTERLGMRGWCTVAEGV